MYTMKIIIHGQLNFLYWLTSNRKIGVIGK